MTPRPSIGTLDKALAGIATLASKSARLSAAEKRELKALAIKGVKGGRQGWTMTDRARCAWLIRKAGPENLPDVSIPRPLRRLIGLDQASAESLPPVRKAPAIDPLDRLEKLGRLRRTVLSPEQFETQRALILADSDLGRFGVDADIDPLDRLEKVAALERAGVIDSDQSAAVTEQILDGTT